MECSPLLKRKTWYSVENDKASLLVKCAISSVRYEVIMFDAQSAECWIDSLDNNEFHSRLLSLNPNISTTSSEKLFSHIEDLLLFKISAEVSTNKELHSFKITFKSKLAKIPFKWEFCGTPVDRTTEKEHLYEPLFAMLLHYRRCTSQLCQKDVELGKKQGSAQLPKKVMETKGSLVTSCTSVQNLQLPEGKLTLPRLSTVLFQDSSVQELYAAVMEADKQEMQSEHQQPNDKTVNSSEYLPEEEISRKRVQRPERERPKKRGLKF